MNKWTLILIAALIGGLLFSIFWNREARASYTEAQRKADSIAGELALQELETQGWAARFAETTSDLEAQVAEQDSALALMVRELTAARGDLVSANNLIASLHGQVNDTIFIPTTQECTGVYEGRYDDGLLYGSWRTTLQQDYASMLLDYSANVQIDLFETRMADGRWMVAARAKDERVDIGIVQSVFDPPPPVVEYKLSKTWATVFTTFGVIIGAWVRGG